MRLVSIQICSTFRYLDNNNAQCCVVEYRVAVDMATIRTHKVTMAKNPCFLVRNGQVRIYIFENEWMHKSFECPWVSWLCHSLLWLVLVRDGNIFAFVSNIYVCAVLISHLSAYTFLRNIITGFFMRCVLTERNILSRDDVELTKLFIPEIIYLLRHLRVHIQHVNCKEHECMLTLKCWYFALSEFGWNVWRYICQKWFSVLISMDKWSFKNLANIWNIF